MRIRKSRKQKIYFKKDDETLKKYLSFDTLPKIARKTRFCRTHTRMMSNLSRRKRDEFGIFLTFFKGEIGENYLFYPENDRVRVSRFAEALTTNHLCR